MRSAILALTALLCLVGSAVAQTGTAAPAPIQTFFTATGTPCANCRLYTFVAGTSTALSAYTDSALTVAHANPIVLDSIGRPSSGGNPAIVYLLPRSYKFELRTAAGSVIWTADNVAATPPFFVDLDIQGTAGEALTAGNVVYLSAGSGGGTAGRWYKADADFTYASSQAGMIGMIPAAIASGATGSIRLQGRITGLSALNAGTPYYASATAGALTSTAPTNYRHIGVADSTTTFVLAPKPTDPAGAFTVGGALTVTGGQIAFPAVPVPSSDANTLDTYAEGVWTPTDASGAALTLGTVEGYYVKVGQMVTATMTATFPATGDGSAVKIGGLPFTVQNSTNNLWVGAAITNAASLIYAQPLKNTTTVQLLIQAGGTNLTNVNISGALVRFTVSYRATQ